MDLNIADRPYKIEGTNASLLQKKIEVRVFICKIHLFTVLK